MEKTPSKTLFLLVLEGVFHHEVPVSIDSCFTFNSMFIGFSFYIFIYVKRLEYLFRWMGVWKTNMEFASKAMIQITQSENKNCHMDNQRTAK